MHVVNLHKNHGFYTSADINQDRNTLFLWASGRFIPHG
jgi:hypothetical protein